MQTELQILQEPLSYPQIKLCSSSVLNKKSVCSSSTTNPKLKEAIPMLLNQTYGKQAKGKAIY